MTEASYRVLVIDDNPWIHEDVRKVITLPDNNEELDRLGRSLFGAAATGAAANDQAPDRTAPIRFEVDSALQGRAGVEAARRARDDGRPYAIAFVDIRMPPGWDGIETIQRLWEVDPALQAVICSAYSDYSWNEIQRRLGGTDRLLVLKKPFDTVEILQLAHTLARKWALQSAERRRADELEALVLACTSRLKRAVGIADQIGGLVRHASDDLRCIRAMFDELDLAVFSAAIPAAFEATLEGLERIAELAGVMKDASRPPEPSSGERG
jgi:CheY-like chemotaxis protein